MPPLSFYNTLFWYGGASSDDTDELPAMNFQDLLERYDLPAIEQSSGKPRVRGGFDHGGGLGGEGNTAANGCVDVENKHAADHAAPRASAKDRGVECHRASKYLRSDWRA